MANPPDTTTTPIAATETMERKRMWLSPSPATASRLFDLANIALIISLAIGVVATVLIVWMGGIKEADAKRELAAVSLETAKANERAAEANKRAAEANEAAEREHLARLQLEAKLADRKLSPKGAKALVDTAKQFPPGTRLDVCICGEEMEIVNFATELTRALAAGGWVTRTWNAQGISVRGVVMGADPSRGATVNAANFVVANLMLDGIDAAEVPFAKLSEPVMRLGPSGPMDAPIRMYIGSK